MSCMACRQLPRPAPPHLLLQRRDAVGAQLRQLALTLRNHRRDAAAAAAVGAGRSRG